MIDMTKIAPRSVATVLGGGSLAVAVAVLLAQIASAGTGWAVGSAAASGSPSATSSGSPSASPSGQAGRYVALDAPTRAFDSRNTAERRRSGVTTVDLSQQVPAAATAAVLNVTLTEATAGGYAVVYAAGSSKPATSNVNFQKGLTQANEVISKVSSDRKVDVSIDGGSQAPSAALVVDVVGFLTADRSVPAGQVTAMTPKRVFDSGQTDQPRRSGETQVDLSGSVGNATTVVLNVTVDAPDVGGHVVVYPTGSAKPATSNVNFAEGQQQANEVFSKVGSNGRVSLSLDGPTPPRARLVVDVVATVGGDAAADVTVTSPQRFLDTRAGDGNVGASPGRKSGPISVALPDSVPAGATAVLLNVTATGADAPGYVTVYAAGAANPGTSNVNFRVGADQANEVITLISSDRKVTLDVGGRNSPGTYLVADVTGYLATSAASPSPSCTPGLLPGVIGSTCASPSASASSSPSPSPSPSVSPSPTVSPSASASPTACTLPPPAPCI